MGERFYRAAKDIVVFCARTSIKISESLKRHTRTEKHKRNIGKTRLGMK